MKLLNITPFLLAVLFVLLSFSVEAQESEYSLKDPGKDIGKHCKDPLIVLRSMPAEARYVTKVQGQNIYVIFPDAVIYQSLIKGAKDGFAIDLIYRNQYNCDAAPKQRNSRFRGQLLPPLYKEDLQQRLKLDNSGMLWLDMGALPQNVLPEEVEPNLVLIHKRYTCHYLSIYDLDMQDWELLDMGLYRDTFSRQDSSKNAGSALSKTLRFTIPFEKNRSEYKQQDIQALYDSLKLTDYHITALRILAYTSVEGSLEHNLDLQKRRAESLVKALETYQGLPVKASIRTSENWVEFLEDVGTTPHKHLVSLSKQEIKEKLKDPQLNNAIEPYLKQHRKGLVELMLQKKVSYFQEPAENIQRYYKQAIAEQDISKALYLQEVIFDRIKNESLPKDYLKQLEVPRHTTYGTLLLRQLSFEQAYLQQDELEALRAFEALQELLPGNTELAYNILALKLKAWPHNQAIADPLELNRSILELRKNKVADALVNRLLINFYITQAQHQFYQRNYREKDKSLQLIYNTYKNLPLSDEDAMRLASFFAFYSRFDWSRAVLQSRVKKLDVQEDVVFYYLNLTAGDQQNTRNKDYRQILNNAYNSNPQRYCQMFGTRGYGGISFQLLQDPYLKQTFCDNCNSSASLQE